ncbi:envelope-like protein [Cucumis melo var. makuwa]|uniref:Envelope-like protein n=1 Tax=Cucumis melo var. makuwa TaxID=1194695 RepID=A0A5D3BMY7_CUCMM|nr:envelope-like protein [Cucumis melo var. makuwa]
MHGVRMSCRSFKSTPPRRPYRLPSEKSEAHVSDRLHEPVQDDVDSRNPVTDAEHAPRTPETHMSDMDSDDLDDVPLARLLKNNFVPDVATEKPIDPPVSVHSQESSSTSSVFVPTPCFQHTSNVEPGPSLYSPPVRSSIPDNTTTSGLHNDLAPASNFESIATEGRIDVHNDEDETDTFPEESRSAKKKFQQSRRNITTKTGRKKIPPHIPSDPIDGISFHLEENVQCWKFVVQRRIADECVHCLGDFPSFHICNEDIVDTRTFMYNQLLRHAGSFEVKIPIALPRFFSGLLFHLNVAEEEDVGFFVDRELTSKFVNSLTVESRAPSASINLLSERRLEVDSLIRHLKTFAPSTSRGSVILMIFLSDPKGEK